MALARRFSRVVNRRSVLLAAALCVGIEQASAVDRSWDNAAGGSYQLNTNWFGDIAPLATDEASFNVGNSNYAVALVGPASNSRTKVADRVLLDLNGSAYNVTSPSSIGGFLVYSLDVGRTVLQPASFAVHNGTLTTVAAAAGSAVGTTGTIRIDPDVVWTVGDTLTAGDLGSGTFDIAGQVTVNGSAAQSGGLRLGRYGGSSGTLLLNGSAASLTVNSQTATGGVLIGAYGNGYAKISNGAGFKTPGGVNFGAFGGAGTVEVTGAGSRWINDGDADIGFNGFGTLSVSNGGTLAFGTTRELSLGTGNTSNSTGLFKIADPGSGATVGHLYIGERTFGTLSVSNGGTLVSTATSGATPSGIVAYGTLSFGTASVTGNNSSWTQNGLLVVGYYGHGTLNVTAGGKVAANIVTVGDFNALANGNVTVDGGSSSLAATTSLYVGGDTIDAGGVGVVTVRNGAAVSAGTMIKVWNNGTFNYANGGTVTTPRVDLAGGGHFDLAAGSDKTLRVNTLNVDINSRLDLANNALVVDYAGANTPFADIKAKIGVGFAGGLWTGNGISSSTAGADFFGTHRTAVGYAEAADLFGPAGGNFAGAFVDGTSVVARYTYYGDTNLDGTVDTQDFARLIAGFGQGSKWSSGDFDFSDTVDGSDFDLFVSNYGQTIALASPLAAPGAVVPEPAAVGVLVAGVLLCRRLRRN